MNNTALNLIAIGIFIMTITSLLGPVLHISPVIPAGVTFVVLGLLTVDNLSWQSRGVTIFLDWVAGFSPSHRQRIIRHEAGHFLAAYFLGIPITGYTLTAWEAWRQKQPGLAGVNFDTESLFTEALVDGDSRLILDRCCTVWMAGIAAEELMYEQSQGGGEDRQKVKQALLVFGYQERQSQQKERWAILQATELLQKYWQSYEALIVAMTDRASVEDCCRVIQGACISEEVKV